MVNASSAASATCNQPLADYAEAMKEKLCKRKGLQVVHSYQDHYHDPIVHYHSTPFEFYVQNAGDGNQLTAQCFDSNIVLKQRRGPRGGVVEPFPIKLHSMLSNSGFEDLVSWQPHGRSFVIRKQKEFMKEVLPRFFKQKKFTSFQRQLNLYGFRRLTRGADGGGYYHEFFLRGRPDLCKCMIRQRVKGTGTKVSYVPETEPNFYSMEFCTENVQPTLDSTTLQDEENFLFLDKEIFDSKTQDTTNETLCPAKVWDNKTTNTSLQQLYFLDHSTLTTSRRDDTLSCPVEKLVSNQHIQDNCKELLVDCNSPTSQNCLASISTKIVTPFDSPVLRALPCPPRLPSIELNLTDANTNIVEIDKNSIYQVDRHLNPSLLNVSLTPNEVASPSLERGTPHEINLLEGLNEVEALILEDLESWDVY